MPAHAPVDLTTATPEQDVHTPTYASVDPTTTTSSLLQCQREPTARSDTGQHHMETVSMVGNLLALRSSTTQAATTVFLDGADNLVAASRTPRWPPTVHLDDSESRAAFVAGAVWCGVETTAHATEFSESVLRSGVDTIPTTGHTYSSELTSAPTENYELMQLNQYEKPASDHMPTTQNRAGYDSVLTAISTPSTQPPHSRGSVTPSDWGEQQLSTHA